MEKLIEFFLGSALITGILIFIGKLIINRGFDAAMKTFENKLELMKIEHQVKFSQLHQDRASIMKELYKGLFALEKRLEHLTTSFQGPEWKTDTERKDVALNFLNECRSLIEENRIFFPEEFCVNVESNLDSCENVIKDMERAKSIGRTEYRGRIEGAPFQSKDRKSSLDLWLEQEEKVKIEIKKSRLELASHFRELLGVKEK